MGERGPDVTWGRACARAGRGGGDAGPRARLSGRRGSSSGGDRDRYCDSSSSPHSGPPGRPPRRFRLLRVELNDNFNPRAYHGGPVGSRRGRGAARRWGRATRMPRARLGLAQWVGHGRNTVGRGRAAVREEPKGCPVVSDPSQSSESGFKNHDRRIDEAGRLPRCRDCVAQPGGDVSAWLGCDCCPHPSVGRPPGHPVSGRRPDCRTLPPACVSSFVLCDGRLRRLQHYCDVQ